ncbi:MAG TPA: GIDE domain-containing protein, partial [Anaerolineaceae bacterium]
NVISIFAWLGGACFCGLLPLGFAAILFFTARKRGQVSNAVASAKKATVAALGPGPGLVRLQGRIAPAENPIDGSAENALVYLRLKVEEYESDTDSSGWNGLTDKARGIPFQLNDGSGAVWVNPEGLDKQLLGDGIVPTDDQVQAACILLDISPKILRGQLRFRLWELRAGQTISVVGGVAQDQNGLVIVRVQGQPFVISPLLGQVVDAKITTQSDLARIWMWVLGIPGLLFLLCGLGGALISLIRVLTNR